jgi:hypothetical protein
VPAAAVRSAVSTWTVTVPAVPPVRRTRRTAGPPSPVVEEPELKENSWAGGSIWIVTISASERAGPVVCVALKITEYVPATGEGQVNVPVTLSNVAPLGRSWALRLMPSDSGSEAETEKLND